MAKRQPLEIGFPFRGLDENWAYRRQPQGSSPDALNVRPYDPILNRLRGGQRGGHSKFFADAVNSPNPIQAIRQIVLALDPASVVADTTLLNETFQYSDGILHELNSDWTDYTTQGSSGNTVRLYAERGAGSGMDVVSNQITGATGNYIPTALYKSTTLGSTYIIEVDVEVQTSGSTVGPNIFFRADPVGKLALYVQINSSAGQLADTGVKVVLYQDDGARNALTVPGTLTATLPNAGVWGDPHTWSLHVNGNNIRLYCDGIELLNFGTQTTYSAQTRVGFGTTDKSHDIQLSAFRIYTAKVPASLRQIKLVVTSGGSIYTGDESGLLIATNGSGVLSSDSRGVVGAYQKAYFADNAFSSYRILNPATTIVSAWTPTAGQLPGGGTGTTYAVTAVDVTNKKITATGATAAFAPNDLIEWFDCTDPKNNQVYKVTADDGSNGLTVQETINSDPGANYGSIRTANVGCRYITLYRGRIVMWGLHTDPHNWFMSAVGDPLNWDYSPATVNATQAVAGNNSDAGKIGDVLNCCAPYSDDLMIMGGDHTLWVMRGDPADGGSIDNISYQTGIAGPEAFTWDPYGTLYFFGSGNLWKLSEQATSLVSLSRNKLDKTFGDINYVTSNVRLLWDEERKGVHIYFTPNDEPSTAPTHYYWDQRTESFWSDQLPASFGPTAIQIFDADSPDDRKVLVGCFDSYIRYIDNSSATDDGTAIASHVEFTPIVPAGDLANSRLVELTVLMGEDSDPVTLQVYADESVQKVLDETVPRYTVTLTGGRNSAIRQRVTGNALRIRMSNSSSEGYQWAMESMTGILAMAGKTRKGHL